MDYDVFISCYHEDYTLAEEVYQFLKSNDVNVFLSTKELRRKKDSEYMDAIADALDKSYHLVVVSSSKETITSKWVKFEWSTFLAEVLSDRKKGQLMTFLADVKVGDLPIQLRHYESFTKDDYKERLLHYVETPAYLKRKEEARIKAEKEEKKRQAQMEEARRRETIKNEIEEKEEDYRRFADTLKDLSKQIIERRKELGECNKTCPVCGLSNPIDSLYCTRCGWTFVPPFDIHPKGNKNHIFTAKSVWKNSCNTNKVDIENTNEIQTKVPELVQPKITFTVDGVSFDMIRVQAGSFMMGSDRIGSEACDDEKPKHKVTLTKDFYIGETVVTQALWKTMNKKATSDVSCDNHPVGHVSWHDCNIFIEKLNKITNRNFRLPTEAEWEYAARGGKVGCQNSYKYSGSNNIDEVAWYNGNSGHELHDVKCKAKNDLGIYDMSGNVWEWCSDRYGDYSGSALTDPVGHSTGKERVIRGGSWDYHAWNCRVAYRDSCAPDDCHGNLGFRLVLCE